jgi:hypothetical protein
LAAQGIAAQHYSIEAHFIQEPDDVLGQLTDRQRSRVSLNFLRVDGKLQSQKTMVFGQVIHDHPPVARATKQTVQQYDRHAARADLAVSQYESIRRPSLLAS